jgi:hypothetical protein
MDLLTSMDLEELARRDRDGVHVSLFMPTHRFGGGVHADQIRWKNAVTAVESVLVNGEMRRPDIDDLLAPAWTLERDTLAWQHMSDGLAMFLRPGQARVFRVPVDVPEIATVGERFVVGPLLRILTGDEHFLLLALSQRQLRLLEGSRHRVEEVVLPDVPSSLRDVVARSEPRSHTTAFATSPAGRGGPAVFYGHGGADEDFRRDEVERFLRRVADGLDSYLAGVDLPVVLVGLDRMVAMYRDIGGYGHIMDDAVVTNPDQLSAEELHAAAWPVVADRLREDKQRIVERFGQLHGTGRASTDPVEIANAASQGRVDTLLLPGNPSCWEVTSTGSPTVLQLGADDTFALCELLDQAAVDTLTRSGHIYAVAESPVPGGGDAAALFRY